MPPGSNAGSPAGDPHFGENPMSRPGTGIPGQFGPPQMHGGPHRAMGPPMVKSMGGGIMMPPSPAMSAKIPPGQPGGPPKDGGMSGVMSQASPRASPRNVSGGPPPQPLPPQMNGPPGTHSAPHTPAPAPSIISGPSSSPASILNNGPPPQQQQQQQMNQGQPNPHQQQQQQHHHQQQQQQQQRPPSSGPSSMMQQQQGPPHPSQMDPFPTDFMQMMNSTGSGFDAAFDLNGMVESDFAKDFGDWLNSSDGMEPK